MGCFTFACCGQCCGLLSLFGIFFLFSVGHMFATQPMFTDAEVWVENHDHDASVSCYMGGVIYVCTLLASAGCLWYDKRRSQRRPVIQHAASSRIVFNPANADSNSNSPAGLLDKNSSAAGGGQVLPTLLPTL